MPTERLSGTGDMTLSGSGRIIWRGVRYTLTVIPPGSAENPYQLIEVTLDATATPPPALELGEHVTLALEDGRYLDMLICGQSRSGVDVLATSGPRRPIDAAPDGERRVA